MTNRDRPDSSALLILALLLATTGSHAQPADGLGLFYTRLPGAEPCPDEEAVRSAVETRLGYNPFLPSGDGIVSVLVEGKGEGFHATIRFLGADGTVQGQREFASRDPRCAQLASAIVFAICIAIDPVRAAQLPASEEVAAPVTNTQAPATSSADARPALVLHEEKPGGRGASLVYAGTIGGHLAVGSMPSSTVGVAAGGSLRRGAVSLGIETRGDLPASEPIEGGTVKSYLLLGALIPCLHRGWLAGCGIVGVGVLRASGEELLDAGQSTTPVILAGPRVAAEFPLGERFALVPHADVLFSVWRTTLHVSGEEVWRTPAVSGAFGLALQVRR